MKGRLTLVTLLAAGFLAAPLLVRDARAQGKAKVVEAKGATKVGGGADANIKTDRAPNSQNARGHMTAPEAKGGPKSRGTTSTLHIDNHTEWYVDIYVDGDYIGQVGPYGDGIAYASPGRHSLYARAPFDNGDALTWGPQSDYISGDYTWRLN